MAAAPRILKASGQDSGPVANSAEDAPPRALGGQRLAARDVRFEPPAGQDEAPPYRLRGILRKSEAYLQETVVALDSPTFVADYPLPQPPGDPAPETPEAADAPEEEAAPPVDVEALRAEWERDWEARLTEAVARARRDGYRDGYEAGEQAVQAEVDATMHTFLEAAGQFSHALQAYIRQTEPLLADLALAVAETVLDAPLPTHIKSVSTKALSNAIEQLAADPPVDVSLHPVDFLHLQETGLIDQLRATHERLRWHPDSTLKQGDWMVQSPKGAIRRLQDELLDTLRRRLQAARPPRDAEDTAPPAPGADADPAAGANPA